MSATYLACLTPPGAAAIATLALRGPAAWTLARELAQRPLPSEPQVGRFWLTRIGSAALGAADEVVVAVKQTLPEPWLELHCHGGREVLRLIHDLFTAHGVVACTWQQLERQTANDPLRTAALEVLTHALTARTAGIALEQYHGAFGRAVDAIQDALGRGDLAGGGRQLAELERYAAVGRHLTTPWRVVLAGAVNVGKSSLVNALAGYQRSVVASTPGTTRDVVTTLLAVDGWPVEVADTAGWRATDTAVEQEGIQRARQALAAADLGLWVLDASAAPLWPDANLPAVRLVVNKVDLPAAWPFDEAAGLRVSAATGAGLAEFLQALADWLVPEVPPPGAAVPFTVELAAAVQAARQRVQHGEAGAASAILEKVCQGWPGDKVQG